LDVSIIPIPTAVDLSATDTGGGCDCGGGGPEVEAAVSPNLLAGMGVGR